MNKQASLYFNKKDSLQLVTNFKFLKVNVWLPRKPFR